MTKKIIASTIAILFLWAFPTRVIAITDPLALPNNKLGVHLLDPGEVLRAAELVNNQGQAEWGYVTVPIQSSDRDRDKWGLFFKQAAEKKVIPIIRVATVPIGSNWDQPNNYDLVDFANFLNDLPWPTQNRYVIIFNEVNRASEFGGFVAPERYAQILNNAITIFKERSPDFFILPAGLDNAAPSNQEFLKWHEYLKRMNIEVPGIFDRIDGWTSHAYPNPGFIGRPTDRTERSISSFKFDLQHLTRYTSKQLPVFITETGWDMSRLPVETVAGYYQAAFTGPWADSRVVTVTPFLLHAGDGPFVVFSLADPTRRVVYEALQKQASRGQPSLATPNIVAPVASTSLVNPPAGFWDKYQTLIAPLRQSWQVLRNLFRHWLVAETKQSTVKVAEKAFTVELADSPLLRQQGLSGRSLLAKDAGMLFIFERPGHHVFWMKDMKFNIDIVWIADDQVVGVTRGYASNPTELLTPPAAVRYVLEVAADSNIKVGDKVEIELAR